MGCGPSKPLPSAPVASSMPARPRSKTLSETTINNQETDNEQRVVHFGEEEEEVDEKDEEETEYPDFDEVQSNFGDRLMSANARSSRPSSALFSP